VSTPTTAREAASTSAAPLLPPCVAPSVHTTCRRRRAPPRSDRARRSWDLQLDASAARPARTGEKVRHIMNTEDGAGA